MMKKSLTIAAWSICLLVLSTVLIATPQGGTEKSKASTNLATLTISLPPCLIFTPDRMRFGNDLYTFNGANCGELTAQKNSGSGTQTLAIEKIDQDPATGGDARGQYYRITVGDIPKKRYAENPLEEAKGLYAGIWPLTQSVQAYAPPPATNILTLRRRHKYPFRITFRRPVSAQNFHSAVGYVFERGAKSNIFLGNGGCIQGATFSHLCFRETLNVTNPDTSEINLGLTQKIELEGVFVAGNIAATVEIRNLRLSPNAIAVGANFVNVSGELLTEYIRDNPSSVIKWANVRPRILELYAKRTRGTAFEAADITGTAWHLNAPDNDPSNAAATTFSSPPEGKLWHTAGNLTLGATQFRGSGTIVVEGNVVFTGPISCDQDTRLGIIASGRITFGSTHVGCGAYVALGEGVAGDIVFPAEPPAEGDTARGIFVSQRNIIIPRASSSPYAITYDFIFAQNPTVLFRELLSVILEASS
jgi:hypothetical protein